MMIRSWDGEERLEVLNVRYERKLKTPRQVGTLNLGGVTYESHRGFKMSVKSHYIYINCEYLNSRTVKKDFLSWFT